MAEDTDRLVARAIASVLSQVPSAPETAVADSASSKLQPWAETAAPVGRNKRPLEELLVELEARVAADPDARIPASGERHPAAAFFERFGSESGTSQGGGGRRRRRRRGGGGGAEPAATSLAPVGDPGTAGTPGRGGRRRRGRRGGGTSAEDATPQQRPPDQARSSAAAPGRRRRRGRRGGGGARPSAE